MKSIFFLALGLTPLFFTPSTLRAEDWTTNDGKVYKDVAVIKTEPDAVTITHHDGGALVPLAKLPADLQKRYNYDPVKAKAAVDARAQADAKNAVALQAEIDQAQVKRKLDQIALDPRNHQGANQPTGSVGPIISDSPTIPETLVIDTLGPVATASTNSSGEHNITGLSHDPLAEPPASNHHSMDDLVDLNLKLRDDHYSPNRHTAASLLLASSYLMPDPLDPNHHSTDELLKSASVLTPPPSNTGSRHSMDSLGGNDPLARP